MFPNYGHLITSRCSILVPSINGSSILNASQRIATKITEDHVPYICHHHVWGTLNFILVFFPHLPTDIAPFNRHVLSFTSLLLPLITPISFLENKSL
jgi:hypothetical protein